MPPVHDTPGRPTMLTAKVHELLVESIQACLPYAVAAQRAGIGEATLWLWIDRGQAARRREQEELDEFPPCPRCLAVGEEPCVTSKGTAASKPHAGRIVAAHRLDPDLIRLVEDLEKAEGIAHARLLAKIQQHGEEHWQALAWILERRYPQLYSLRYRDAHADTPDTGPEVPASLVPILDSISEYAAGLGSTGG